MRIVTVDIVSWFEAVLLRYYYASALLIFLIFLFPIKIKTVKHNLSQTLMYHVRNNTSCSRVIKRFTSRDLR